MKRNLINVSLLAKKKLEDMIYKSKTKYILFNVEGGGCNGLKYNLEPTNNKPMKIDEIIKIDELKINVCGKSLLYLIGTEIDWKEDYMGSRFIFNNPNAASKCGCGTTFSV